MQITLNESGQIVLPESALQHLHIKPGDVLELIIADYGEIKLMPAAKPVTQLKGILPVPSKKLSIEEMEKAISKGANQ
jgi:bifunctional DNA-binding transcriptional regulator/antitoxin component of YhaV-PrlF toxin-antitoxin module